MALYNSTDCFYMKEPSDNQPLYTPITTVNGTRGLVMSMYDARETNTSTIITMMCEKGTDGLVLRSKDYDPLTQTFTLTYESKDICPGEIYDVVWSSLGSLRWVFLVIGLIVGPLELFLGYKVFRITIFIVC